MNQTQETSVTPQVAAFMAMMEKGTPETWKQYYRVCEFRDVIPRKSADTLFMDFEYSQRDVFYRCINGRFIKKKPIDYLEFGVATGQSFFSWLSLNKNEESRFWGFDSFQGLPEDWQANAPKGAYTTNGKVPQTDDSRASFLVGLFQETVGEFSRTFTPENRLVLHMDADLYSSTLYCLMNLDRHITPGTIILFDEFTGRNYTDEFGALQDYCLACYRDYEIIASRTDYVKLAIEITK